MTQEVKTVTISVRTLTDKVYSIDSVNLNTWKVSDLKQKYNDKTGTPIDQIILCIDTNGKIMEKARNNKGTEIYSAAKMNSKVLQSNEMLSKYIKNDKTEIIIIPTITGSQKFESEALEIEKKNQN